MNFEANGMLLAGFHDCSVNDFITTFVDGFPTSQRRKFITEALWDFAEEIFKIDVPYEFWIDGSFATTKINPNDADIIVFLQEPALKILGPRFLDFRNKYNGVLDIYFSCAVSPESQKELSPNDYQKIVNNRNYWRGQFGFDRNDIPKGIVRIDCDSLKEYLKGR